MTTTRQDYQRDYRVRNKARTKRVNLTLNPEEFGAFSKAARAEKEKTTSFIKRLALEGLTKKTKIPDSLQEELRTLRFAVLNIANNVNQIAHHSNTISRLTEADEHNLLQHLKQLDGVIRSYTAGQILDNQSDT